MRATDFLCLFPFSPVGTINVIHNVIGSIGRGTMFSMEQSTEVFRTFVLFFNCGKSNTKYQLGTLRVSKKAQSWTAGSEFNVLTCTEFPRTFTSC